MKTPSASILPRCGFVRSRPTAWLLWAVVILLVHVPEVRSDNTLEVVQTDPLTVEATFEYDSGLCQICQQLRLDWGDGSPEQIVAPPAGGTAIHVYSRPGSYTVTLFCTTPNPPAVCEAQATINVTDRYRITASPRVVNITDGQSRTLSVTYTLTGGGTLTAVSDRGRFTTERGTLLDRVERSLTLSAVNSRGTARETVRIPAGLVRRARGLGEGPIRYVRTFEHQGYSADGFVVLQPVPSSAGPFSLARMELSFARPDEEPQKGWRITPYTPGRITVPRHSKDLKVLATLTYNGSGTLRAQWRVDGQILGFVNRFLHPGGREVTLESPEVPPLPTFDTGRHSVELEILQPVPEFDEPVIFYYVIRTGDEETLRRIPLTAPEDRETVRLSKDAASSWVAFAWEPLNGAERYLFTLHSEQAIAQGNDRPAVSARTVKGSYVLSLLDLDRLSLGIPHVWRVRAYHKGSVVGRSLDRRVFFSDRTAKKDPLTLELLGASPSDGAAQGSPLRIHGDGKLPVTAGLRNHGEASVYNVRVEFLLDGGLADVSFIPRLRPGEVREVRSVLQETKGPPKQLQVRAVKGNGEEAQVLARLERDLAVSD